MEYCIVALGGLQITELLRKYKTLKYTLYPWEPEELEATRDSIFLTSTYICIQEEPCGQGPHHFHQRQGGNQ